MGSGNSHASEHRGHCTEPVAGNKEPNRPGPGIRHNQTGWWFSAFLASSQGRRLLRTNKVYSTIGWKATKIRPTPPYTVQAWQGYDRDLGYFERFTKLVVWPNNTKQITGWRSPAGSSKALCGANILEMSKANSCASWALDQLSVDKWWWWW